MSSRQRCQVTEHVWCLTTPWHDGYWLADAAAVQVMEADTCDIDQGRALRLAALA